MTYLIGENSIIDCPNIEIGEGTVIGDNVTIEVQDKLVIGRNSYIGNGCEIKGRKIEIKREFRAVGKVTIGGGSCFERRSRLKIGYWGHLGLYSFVNTAEEVTIGNEVGIGGNSNLFTHGAYLDVLSGFPSQWGPIRIGSHVWMPCATVHPKVTIGDFVVIGSNSLVTKDIPSNCFALGIPCRVVKSNVYPSVEKNWKSVIKKILKYNDFDLSRFEFMKEEIKYKQTYFNIRNRTVSGKADSSTENIRHKLRRRGIRFKTEIRNGQYQDWDSEF